MNRSNREATAELRSQLNALPLGHLSASTLGHANFAYLRETRAAEPWDTPSGANQTLGLLRKGTTLGEINRQRVSVFLAMLREQADPAQTVEEWSLRNGHVPQAPGIGGGHVKHEPRPEPVAPEVEVDPELIALLAPVQERYEEAKAETDRLQAELAKAREESNRLLAILKAAGIVPRATYQKKEEKKPKKKSKNSHVSDETAQKILEGMRGFVASNPPVLEDVPGSFTRPQIEKALGLHHSQVAAAVEKLREQGYVRAAGLTQAPSGQKANVYAVVA